MNTVPEFVEGLATHHRLPGKILQAMALVVAGAMAGGSLKRHQTAAKSPSLHLIIAGQTEEITQRIKQALKDLLQPVRDLQRELIERRSMLPVHLEAECESWRRELHRLEAAPFPDPRHIEHLKARIRDYQRQTRIQILTENARAGTLAQAVSTSPDESILNIITDDGRLNTMLNRCHTPPVIADLDLLRASWLGHGYFSPGGVALSTPCINTVAVCNAGVLRRFLSHGGLREAGVTEMFLPLLVLAGQCEAVAGEDGVAGGGEWAGLIRRLYEWRGLGGEMESMKDSEASWILDRYCTSFRVDSEWARRQLWDLVFGNSRDA